MDKAKQDNNCVRVEKQFYEYFTELSQLVFELNVCYRVFAYNWCHCT